MTTADYCGLSTVGYIAVGTYYNLVEHTVPMWVHFAWACMLLLPLVILPFSSWMYLKIDWSIKKMFDWFKGKNKMPSNVVPFPTTKTAESRTYDAPNPEPNTKTFYSIGITDDARVSFKVGEHTTLILNRNGLTNLINQLQVFEKQLPEE